MEKKYLGSYEMIEIKAGGYTLQAVPQLGGQVISLEKGGLQALHTPASQEALDQASTAYGLPVLFPPNRIDGGHFQTPFREYQFPVNETARGNSLHGFLHTRPWQVAEVGEDHLKLQYKADETTDFYPFYPHAFTAAQTYRLDENGLHQEIAIENQSGQPMPVGLGFHSAFAADKQTKVRVSVGKRILMSERMLPTGEVRSLNEEEQRLRAEGLEPVAWSMDDHYTAEPIEEAGRPFHGAVITRAGGKVIYEVDPFYQHWMIWNAAQQGEFICIEPQNWRVNAPNLVNEGMEEGEAGFCMLNPGETLKVWAALRIELN